MIHTDRCLLRQWKHTDYTDFAQLNNDPDVMEFFPERLESDASNAMANKIQTLIECQGWGFWALEIPHLTSFAGFVGLHHVKPELPCAPSVEIGWRLAKSYWGKGYATEAALACLQYAFSSLKLPEVVSFTATLNTRSQQVMDRIGMVNTGNNFLHPDVQESHPLQEHVLFKITREQWAKHP